MRLEDFTLTGVITRSSAKAKSYDRLWVDWNGDKKFTGEEKLMGTETGKGEEKFVVFGPVERTLNEGNLVVRGQDGECLLPTGSHQTQWVTVSEPDKQGKLWQAVIYFYRQIPRFRVTSNKLADLPFGPPFKLVLDVKRRGKSFEFSLSLEDRAGNSVNAVFTPDTKQPKEPVSVVKDMKGRIVKTAKFHYG